LPILSSMSASFACIHEHFLKEKKAGNDLAARVIATLQAGA